MPRNYDEIRDNRDLSFIVRGQTFTLKDARPEVLDQIDELQTNFVASKETTWAHVAEFAEKRLKLLLQNGDAERWDALRASEETPVSYYEISDLSKWAFEQVTGLPTKQPASSGDGQSKTVASSRDA